MAALAVKRSHGLQYAAIIAVSELSSRAALSGVHYNTGLHNPGPVTVEPKNVCDFAMADKNDCLSGIHS